MDFIITRAQAFAYFCGVAFVHFGFAVVSLYSPLQASAAEESWHDVLGEQLDPQSGE